MKNIQLFIVLAILLSGSSSAFARNQVSNQVQGSDYARKKVMNQFGLSGTINRYNEAKSIIMIDGINYKLTGKGFLTHADLKARLKIKYNLEKSATEKMGRITRIWVE